MNITSLVGSAGGEATLITTAKGVKIANFSLATVKRYKDGEGVQQKHTDWHNIAVFGPKADVVKKLVVAGSVIGVTGTFYNKAYTDKAGVAQPSCTLHADTFEVMSTGKKSNPAPADKPQAPAAPKLGDTCTKCNSGTFVQKIYKSEDYLACNKYPECRHMIKIKK